MEQIQHKFVDVRGLKLHVAEVGCGPVVVVFLHGFPEIWYTWRYQMVAVAQAGFKVMAPDFRGYGLSEKPAEPEKGSFEDLVDDLLAMLDFFGIPKVVLVGKDFGAFPISLFALHHQDRLLGMVTMGVPFTIPGPTTSGFLEMPEGFYIMRWREPGRAEADFGRFDAKTVVRNIYILFSKSDIPVAQQGHEIMDLVAPSTPLPPWFSEEDLSVYADLYEKSGFDFALQVPYRSLSGGEIPSDPKVEVPALLIMGEKDYVLKFPGMEHYIRSGKVKDYVPNLEIVYVPDGSHFIHEQLPDQVNQLLLAFLNRFK